MRVSELAKELGITNDDVLAKLRSLHLKAKDGHQEINEAVLAVLKRELKNAPKAAAKAKESAVEAKKESKTVSKKEAPSKKTKTEAKVATKAKAKKITKEKTREEKPKLAVGKEKIKAEKPAVKKEFKSAATPAKTQVVIPAIAVKAAETKPTVEAAKRELPKTQPQRPHVSYPARKIEIRPKEKLLPSKEIKAASPFKIDPKKTLEPIELEIPISVKDLAFRFQQKPSVIMKYLVDKGLLVNINQNLDEETVKELASVFGFILIKIKTKEEELMAAHTIENDDPRFLKPRSPVVTFMGHVDHGKTSLLDKIRKTKVADKEHGGITQHIGAYSVNIPKGRIAFLDTPGHEAFTSMRARGAHITDLIVLVVAADEGIMPQTEEAIDHARAAGVPIVVALNKIDKKGAEVDKVKKQLSEKGLASEDWGGKTIVVGVSAVTGEGIDNLLEMLLLEAELLELKANYDKKASGIVVEAQLSRGKGPMATVIVQNGTLREGDMLIVGPHFGRVKAMLDDHERPIKEAGPATPAEILGLSGVPEAGEMFYAVADEKQAREIVAKRQEHVKNQKLQPLQKITLEDLYAQIQQGKIKELNIILKADVQGSLEALKDSLAKIPSDEVQLKFIHSGVGEINASDVILAEASNAIVIGFNMTINPRAQEEIEKRQVDVRTYRIIYDAINDVKNALSGLLEPRTKKNFLGRVEIRQIFQLSRSGKVAGCFVAKGRIHRKAAVDVVRNGAAVFSGTLSSLKRFKDDVREVTEGFECGLTVHGFDEIQAGDIVEAYELEKIARTL